MSTLFVKIQRDFASQTHKFKNLKTAEDLAALLEIPYRQLGHILYKQNPEDKYKTFTIPKKNGDKRIINAPIKSLDIIQRKLLPLILDAYSPKDCVHGFVKKRGIVSNAKAHRYSAQRKILNIDLSNFYDSINFGRVRGLLMSPKSFNIGAAAASVIAHILCKDGKLPQGASTSPVIANMILSRLDSKLISLCRKNRCTYSRYADDMTISFSSRESPSEILTPCTEGIQLSKDILEIIASEGFEVNHQKVRLATKRQRQEITGLTVNEFLNVRRRFIRNLKAMIYVWKRHGLTKAATTYLFKNNLKIHSDKITPEEYFKSVVYGKFSYMYMVRGKGRCDPLTIKYAQAIYPKLDPKPPNFIIEMTKMNFDVFISYASEDHEIANLIAQTCAQEKIKAFIDTKQIGIGESIPRLINDAFKSAKVLLFIATRKYESKKWTNEELFTAFNKVVKEEMKLFPLIVESTESFEKEYPLLSHHKYMKWEGDGKQVVDELKKMIAQKQC